MKKSFEQLYVDFPITIDGFEEWLLRNYRVTPEMFDDSISMHRYIIACRYLGEITEVPRYVMDDELERRMVKLFERQEAAFSKNIPDPLEELSNLPFSERNSVMEGIFARQTKPGLRDTLRTLTSYIRPGMFETLIPYTPPKEVLQAVQEAQDKYSETMNEMLWLDNIQWAWNVRDGKINVPF